MHTRLRFKRGAKHLEVFQSFNGSWMVGTQKANGNWQRFKSPRLPVCNTREDAERALSHYAAIEDLEAVIG